MREIDSREYAEMVEDTITGNVEGAIANAFTFLARHYGFALDYDEREKAALEICDELWASGTLGNLRDEVIALFEKHGMDVKSDGREF